MLTVVTFLWGTKYEPVYVDRLGEGLWRHMDQRYRFVCVTDRVRTFGRTVMYQERLRDPELSKEKGCFARLRLFDPDWQMALGLSHGERLLVLDLDLIITGKLSALVNRPEPFVILQGVNSPSHPCRYNGSVWLTTAGYRSDVWHDFSMEQAKTLPILPGGFPGDQEWFQHKLPDAGAFTEQDGVYAFGKGSWPKGSYLPENARIVAFPGSRDPKHFTHLPWVRQQWMGIA
jgi:hypothetical protein